MRAQTESYCDHKRLDSTSVVVRDFSTWEAPFYLEGVYIFALEHIQSDLDSSMIMLLLVGNNIMYYGSLSHADKTYPLIQSMSTPPHQSSIWLMDPA